MTRSKKIFLIVAAIFLLLLIYASIDIGRKTTFPGAKGQLKERIIKDFGKKDSLTDDIINDSIN